MPIELAWWMVPAFETLLLLTAVMLIVNWISGDDFIDTTVGQIIAYILACWLAGHPGNFHCGMAACKRHDSDLEILGDKSNAPTERK